jgi:prevent-host-death family protein
MPTTTSISELKARLSAFLDLVRAGDEVLVTDRGRVVARLVPVHGAAEEDSRREMLVRTGRLQLPRAPLPKGFRKARRPADARGRSLAALLQERVKGR